MIGEAMMTHGIGYANRWTVTKLVHRGKCIHDKLLSDNADR